MLRKVALALWALGAGCTADQHAAVDPANLDRFLAAGDSDGYAQALEPVEFEFPRDHNAHPRFRSEWWYFTGHLSDSGGREFGFQLTFFRFALSSVERAGRSPWHTRQAWMGHMAVTDVRSGRFIRAERFSREALGLAGNSAEPYRIWIEDWSASARSAAPFPLQLRAATAEAALDLALTPTKPPIAHGERGLDVKGPQPGNASYYYSMPRLEAAGTVTVGGGRHEVSGSAWLDREWSTSALDSELAGWDWLALELSDGRDLMLYRLRTHSGSASAFSSGALIGRDGTAVPLGPTDFELAAHTHWTSPATGARYPVGWTVDVPAHGLELDVRPLLANQEMNLTVRYWEGAVTARGSAADAGAVSGRGYLELTGY